MYEMFIVSEHEDDDDDVIAFVYDIMYFFLTFHCNIFECGQTINILPGDERKKPTATRVLQ